MKCNRCKRDINRGTEMAKSIAEYLQDDKSIKTYGWDRPDGPWQGKPGSAEVKPVGKLLRVYHYKCYRVAEKRENRGGDAVSGRGMGSIPTAYEIGKLTANIDELAVLGISEEEARTMNTQALTDRVREQRKMAVEQGIGTDNWSTKELIRAQEHGGPYYHRHMFPPKERFQLLPHLQHAHGQDAEELEGLHTEELIQRHNELHAKLEQEVTRKTREVDPGYTPIKESDWREQRVVEVGEVQADLGDKHETSGEELSLDDLLDR